MCWSRLNVCRLLRSTTVSYVACRRVVIHKFSTVCVSCVAAFNEIASLDTFWCRAFKRLSGISICQSAILVAFLPSGMRFLCSSQHDNLLFILVIRFVFQNFVNDFATVRLCTLRAC